jgi:hypothetical protein
MTSKPQGTGLGLWLSNDSLPSTAERWFFALLKEAVAGALLFV